MMIGERYGVIEDKIKTKITFPTFTEKYKNQKNWLNIQL